MRGLSNELSSSKNQTPAPVAVDYYGKGEAMGRHLSLMRNSSAHDPGKGQTLSTL
jgi:hypothetical protein